MKILNLIPESRYSGPVRRVVDVAVQLRKLFGTETIVVLPTGEGSAARAAAMQDLVVRHVSYTKVPRPSHIVRVLRWLFLLPKDIVVFRHLIQQECPDLVHINSAFFLPLP